MRPYTTCRTILCWLVWFGFLASPAGLKAQTPSPTTTPAPQISAGEDSDPTRPVVWSVREEYYDLKGDDWRHVLILRSDHAFFQNRPRLGGRRGWLTRFDLPLVLTSRQSETRGGLGDLYAQVIYVPYLDRKFALAAGTGFVFPTATDSRLGRGKWTVAPVVAPVWFLERRGFLLVKLQDYISVAGDEGRPDVHYFTTTPLLVWRLKRRWWIQLDTETRTDFKASGHTDFKSGFLIGRMIRGKLGVWIKPEVHWGRYRQGDFVVKTSLFQVR